MANNNNSFKEPRINREITGYNEVRLIYKEYRDGQSENDFNKVVKWSEAVSLSKEKGLDLIEINSKINPPIIKLEDYSKYLYELKKQLKQRKKNTTTLKEIQLLHDALWGIPYNSLCEGAEYDAKDEVYNIEDLNILCNDFNSIVHSLGGYTSEFETY